MLAFLLLIIHFIIIWLLSNTIWQKKSYKWFIHTVTFLRGTGVYFINVVTSVVWYHPKTLKFNQVYWSIQMYNNNTYLIVLVTRGSWRISHPDSSHLSILLGARPTERRFRFSGNVTEQISWNHHTPYCHFSERSHGETVRKLLF